MADDGIVFAPPLPTVPAPAGDAELVPGAVLPGTIGWTAEELRQALKSLGTPPAGIDYVVQVATSPPSRAVGSRRKRNVIWEVPLQRLLGVLQAESSSGEYHFLLKLDAEDDVVAAFDQPTTVPLEITDSAGRQTRTQYTGDYLVVRHSCVVIYEVKPRADLDALCKARPLDWTVGAGAFCYRPAKDYFQSLGIRHEVVVADELSPVLTDNLKVLSSAKDAGETRSSWRVKRKALQIVEQEQSIRLGDIAERLELSEYTPLFQLLQERRLYADLEHQLLANPEDVWVASSPAQARIASLATRSLAAHLATLAAGDVTSLWNPKYALTVALHYSLATGKFDPADEQYKDIELPSERSVRRYKRCLRLANGDVQSLFPRWPNCGPKGPRISPVHFSHLCAHVHLSRSDPNLKSISAHYRDYKKDFMRVRREKSLSDKRPVSERTYRTYWNTLGNKSDDGGRRGGRRLSNTEAESADPSKPSLVVVRPFSVAHIDHYHADIFLRAGVYQGKVIALRPWITAMVDAFTDEVLAFWIAFAAPSRKACAMVIRDCVRRHGRLPETIVVDGGSEFHSNHFAAMLATLRVTRATRPPEDPRFGTKVERFFLDLKQRFLSGLPGFGVSLAMARKVSGAFHPSKRARLEIGDLATVVDLFIANAYNASPSADETLGRSAIREEHVSRVACSGIEVTVDLAFLVLTSVDAPVDTYQMVPGRGIHVYDKWFTHPKLYKSGLYKKDLHVRLEPHDPAIVYVYLDDRWFVCRSQRSAFTQLLSERDVLTLAAKRFDLRALRRQIKEEADREAAEIVRQELERILKSKKPKKRSTSTGKTKHNSADRLDSPMSRNSAEESYEFEDLEL